MVSLSGEDNPGDGRPVEILGWENDTGGAAAVQLVVNRYSGGDPRLKLALLQNGGGVTATEYESSAGGDVVGPTIFGHNGGESVLSVGAIRFNATAAPEGYSSRGPVAHYFGPVDGATPAAPLATPQVLSKPDLTATDCGVTTFFAFESAGKWRFCGTSAAAPHAAGVAALMLDADPAATPDQIRAALWKSGAAVGGFDACAVGAGLLDAVAAVDALLAAEGAAAPACAPPASPPIEEGGGGGEGGEGGEGKTGSEEGEGGFGGGEGGEGGEGGSGDGGGTGAATAPASPTSGQSQSPSATQQPPRSGRAQPPNTLLLRRPPRTLRTRRRAARAVFRFAADRSPVTFLCRVDRGRFHPCPARFVRRYRVGRHVLRVKARTAAGATDASPAVCRFRVRRTPHGLIERRRTRRHHHG